jgi:hypothetical protein
MEKSGGIGKVAGKSRICALKKLGRGTFGDCLGAAAFALFIGYVLSECSGVAVKKT